MNLKAVVNIEIEKDGHNYIFSMPLGSPWGTAYNVAHEVLQEIVKQAKNAADQTKETSSDAVPSDVILNQD